MRNKVKQMLNICGTIAGNVMYMELVPEEVQGRRNM